ncbi:MAG: ArnT family glycosyltransferase [Phycisphaerae bacterium]
MPDALRIPLITFGVAVAVAGLISPDSAIALIYDGSTAALLIFPMILGGLAVLPRQIDTWPLRWRILIGAGAGIGVTAMLVLLLGLAGMLNRYVMIGILLVAGAGGVFRMRSAVGAWADAFEPPTPWHRALLLLAPFLTLMILAASNPPGTIWAEEGYGYDILEYHLQVPREHVQNGAISFLPHNVYANFPSNMEMLYLLAMLIMDDPYDAASVANYLHAAMGLLCIFAAWCIGRDWSQDAGVLATLCFGSANWIWYFAGLAYVELMLIFFGLVAIGLCLRIVNSPGDPVHAMLAGVMAGFACGTKYTAVPMIAAPVILSCLAMRRPKAALIVGLGAAMAFSPWLVKNVIATADPVFPLGESVFAARPEGWTEQSAEMWARGHQPSTAESSLSGRFLALWSRVPGDPLQRFGPAVFLLALLGLYGRQRDRSDVVLIMVAGMQLLVWLFATHLYARFAVVFLIPLVLLGSRSTMMRHPVGRKLVAAVILAGVTWNLAFALPLVQQEQPYGGLHASTMTQLQGYGIVNNELPADASILLVGESKAFYFDRNVDYHVVFNEQPLAALLEQDNSGRSALAWMAEQGYSHVLVNWLEIQRLSRTYGFPEVLNPDTFEMLCRRDDEPRLVVRNEIPLPDTNRRYLTIYTLEWSGSTGN